MLAVTQHRRVCKGICTYMQEETGKMEHLMAQRTALQLKKADFERRIKDLGSLPGDAFDKYRDTRPAELHKQLTRCNGHLKQYRCAERRLEPEAERAASCYTPCISAGPCMGLRSMRNGTTRSLQLTFADPCPVLCPVFRLSFMKRSTAASAGEVAALPHAAT